MNHALVISSSILIFRFSTYSFSYVLFFFRRIVQCVNRIARIQAYAIVLCLYIFHIHGMKWRCVIPCSVEVELYYTCEYCHYPVIYWKSSFRNRTIISPLNWQNDWKLRSRNFSLCVEFQIFLLYVWFNSK